MKSRLLWRRLCSATLLGVFCGFAAAGAEVASGVAWGRADATYRLGAATGAPAPPSYANRTFAQSVRAKEGEWEITVASSPSPVTASSPLRLNWASPALRPLDPAFVAAMRSGLVSSTTQEEAVLRLGLMLRAMTAYTARPDFTETPEEVSRRRIASCVGLVRIGAILLNDALNIRCQTVIGLKAPLDDDSTALSGGALHAWLEVDLGPKGRVFFDPWFSYGWVPESYIVLRVGGSLEPEEFSRLAGGHLKTLWRRDRIFYLPAQNSKTLFWAAGAPVTSGGAVIAGKALCMDETPIRGTAWIENSGGRVAAELWDGNFCFRGLGPGSYDVSIESQGAPIWEGSVTLGALDIRELTVYSRLERGRRGTPTIPPLKRERICK